MTLPGRMRMNEIASIKPAFFPKILYTARARIESASSSASNALHYDAKKPPETTAPSSLSPSASSWSNPFIRPSDGDLVNPTGLGECVIAYLSCAFV